MEAQQQVEDIHVISYQHANGEVFEASNLEAAHGACPVLGKLSLEEAGLLLELEDMGKEQIVSEQKTSTDKPVIEKVERLQPKRDERKFDIAAAAEETARKIVPEIEEPARRIIELNAEVSIDRAVSKLVESEAHDALTRRVGIERIAKGEAKPVIRIAEPKKVNKHDTKTEKLRPDDEQSIVKAPIRIINKPAIHMQNNKSSQKQLHEATHAKVQQLVQAATPAERVEQPQPDVVVVEPKFTFDVEKSQDADVVESIEENADTAEANENMSVVRILKRHKPEKSDNEELPEILMSNEHERDELADIIPVELSPAIAIPELPAPIIEIEVAIKQLSEVMEADKYDGPAKLDDIVEEIIALPAILEVAADEETEVLEEKLEVLFVKLFEEAGVSCTPDLVKSFVVLTKAHYFEKLVEVAKDSDEDIPHLPVEIGTREFLQKLQHGLPAMKQATMNFYQIGKSVLRLYSTDFSLTLASVYAT